MWQSVFSTAVSLCIYDRYGVNLTLLPIYHMYPCPSPLQKNRYGSRLEIVTWQCTPAGKIRMEQDCSLLPGDVPRGWLKFHYKWI